MPNARTNILRNVNNSKNLGDFENRTGGRRRSVSMQTVQMFSYHIHEHPGRPLRRSLIDLRKPYSTTQTILKRLVYILRKKYQYYIS